MSRIIIISIYLGKLPEYFRLWLKSCDYNKSVDFLLITDQKVENVPDNVHLLNHSLSTLKGLIEKKLGREVVLGRPYKLCDYKPMYGLIFDDEIKSYDYWGHCDIDLIFGDLRYFFDKYKLEEYDRFLHLGHLSLYKNTPESNRYFMLSGSKCGSWEDVISTDKNCLYDEWNGIYGVYKKHNIPMFEKRIFADISMIYSRFRLALNDKNYDYQVFYWDNGKIWRTSIVNDTCVSDEFIYIHFKRRNMPKESFDADHTAAFYIGPSGFHERIDNNISYDTISKYNPFKGAKYEENELRRFEWNEKYGIKIKRKFSDFKSLWRKDNGK